MTPTQKPLAPKVMISATEGRGVSTVKLFVDDGEPADAGLALLSRLAPAIATIDRTTRFPGKAGDA
jgi:hypothetical protein